MTVDRDDPRWTAYVLGDLEGDDLKELHATLEDSEVEAGQDGKPPSVETRQLSINAILTPGEPLEVGRVEGIRDRSGFVEVEARILH